MNNLKQFKPTNEQITALNTASHFASNVWQSQQQLCQEFITQYPLNIHLNVQDIHGLIQAYTAVTQSENSGNKETSDFIADEATVMKGLRLLRKLLMMRWIWQDTLALTNVPKLTSELSLFADECIKFAKEYSFNRLLPRYGRPSFKDKQGNLNYDDMAIFAMGKLGANELNLSSDIDLIFVHSQQGYTDVTDFPNAKQIDNKGFMRRLGQGIIKLLDTNTADGFVFRVDMRLRPWGDGSDLAIHLSALQKYFANNGRDWERFAWLKARLVNTISEEFVQQLNDIIKPFVFRHYVDYSTFSALREMKALIENQIAQREDLTNVKLGAGGIRDIEFVVQAFQLIYGGRYPQLQVKPCLQAMDALLDFGLLEKSTHGDLKQAYLFLRRLEHGIQATHDKQTQQLPIDEEWQINLATTLGFNTWPALLDTLNEHRQKVSKPFNQLVTDRQESTQLTLIADLVNDNNAKLFDILDQTNKDKLEQFWGSKLVQGLSSEARERLDKVYPILVQALIAHEHKTNQANVALPRLIKLLESICRRSIYLVMLAENPHATINLIPMLSASPWIANELSSYPVLLDAFLQERYHHLPDKAELQAILRQSLLRVEPGDEENLLNSLRLFKKMQVLAVAGCDVIDNHHIMKISDSLTYIAEVVLEATLQRAFDELVRRHGYPVAKSGESVTKANCGFAIIGYGKLGGIELSYSSDLDLVFIHQIDENAMTNGEKPVSGMKFAARLAQKLMTYLSTQTRDGRAYEIDMRLRPSGNAGMMVLSTKAFETYQMNKAWEWEHQALVRARAICGDKDVMIAFDEIRHHVLSQSRDKTVVKAEVAKMRKKMQDHLGSNSKAKNEGLFHLKQDAGGIVDIEFIAQYGVLAYAHDYPSLTKWSDNVRIFESLSQNKVWSDGLCQQLTDAYLRIRATSHQLALAGKKLIVNQADWQETREVVMNHWDEVIEKR